MKISLGSDHRGIELRATIADRLKADDFEVNDLGTHSTESVDYPDIVAPVAKTVASGVADFAVLICGTGIGVSIAANKFPGIRAAVCHDMRTAKLSRQHNNANVLCLPADTLSGDQMAEMVLAWAVEPFEGGRHARRLEKIHRFENS